MSLALYYHTIKFLKFRQIFCKLIFPLKNIYNQFSDFNKYKNITLKLIQISYAPGFDSTKTQSKLIFNFLNISHDFGTSIDWNIKKYGQLWNYNLHYLDFLLDDRLSIVERLDLLKDISKQILNRSLKLESYPVSLRLINTLIFLSKFQINDSEIILAIKKQTHFLESNLEYHIDANHLLENAIALRFSSLFLDHVPLRNMSSLILFQLLEEQILSDGGHYERSPMYHLILLNRLCILLSAMSDNDSDYQKIISLIVRMWSWINEITDYGKISPLLQDSTGSYLKYYFSIQDFINSKSWDLEKLALSDSKYRILKNSELFVLMNCGNAQPIFQPGHAHSDELGIILYYNNIPIIVDTGVSTYETGADRIKQRSSVSHNTVILNDKSHSEIWSSFRMARRSKIKIISDEMNELEAELIPFHSKNYRFSRKVKLISNGVKIIDQFHSTESHSAKVYFHLNFNSSVVELNNSSFVVIDKLRINFENAISIHIENYQQALDFNRLEDAECIVVEFKDHLITEIYV